MNDTARQKRPCPSWRRTLPITLPSVLLLLLIPLVVVAIWRWNASRREPVAGQPVSKLQKPAPPDDGYLDGDSCSECHAQIARHYARHPMAQSLAPVLEAAPVEDYEHQTRFEAGGREYRVEMTREGVLHHELGRGGDQQVVYDQQVGIHYAVGSGRRGRSYLLDRDGLLFLSPISWYSQAERWDLSPEYSAQHHPRFEREASDRCLQCHAGRLHYNGRSTTEPQQRYAQPPFAEHGIGCQRCHGPGREHVQYQRRQQPGGEDPIVNPADLPPSRRDAVCLQCHLQGEHQILRYGRRHDDFRPGDELGAIWSVFVKPAAEDGSAAPAVSQAEQMRRSRCFQGSDGRLGCISCHDPHRIPDAAERLEFFRRRCLQCHQVNDCRETEPVRRQVDDSCIECHMPTFDAEDVPHTTQTDHRIPRRPQHVAPAESAPRPGPGQRGEMVIFDEDILPLDDLERDRAMGLMRAERAEWRGDRDEARQALPLLQRARQAAPDDLEVLDKLALCCFLTGDQEVAIRHWQNILEFDPRRRAALHSLAVHFHNAGESARALEYLGRYLEQQPWNAEMHGRHSHALWEAGRLNEALAAAERSLQLDPSITRTYAWLAQLHLRRGERRQSEHYRRLWSMLSR